VTDRQPLETRGMELGLVLPLSTLATAGVSLGTLVALVIGVAAGVSLLGNDRLSGVSRRPCGSPSSSCS
jgi:hypothetical protein